MNSNLAILARHEQNAMAAANRAGQRMKPGRVDPDEAAFETQMARVIATAARYNFERAIVPDGMKLVRVEVQEHIRTYCRVRIAVPVELVGEALARHISGDSQGEIDEQFCELTRDQMEGWREEVRERFFALDE